jgi:hypothetical protein
MDKYEWQGSDPQTPTRFNFLESENFEYSSAPESTRNMFQDLPRLRKTADNTERYI